MIKRKMKTMKEKVYDLIKNEIFYDDDLNSWWESHDFSKTINVMRKEDMLYLFDHDEDNNPIILTIDLTSLDCYKFEMTETSTLI